MINQYDVVRAAVQNSKIGYEYQDFIVNWIFHEEIYYIPGVLYVSYLSANNSSYPIDMAREEVARKMADQLKKYVIATENKKNNGVDIHLRIALPYIKDEAFKKLEADQNIAIGHLEHTIKELESVNRLLEREIYGYKTMTFWQRLKFMFTKRYE